VQTETARIKDGRKRFMSFILVSVFACFRFGIGFLRTWHQLFRFFLVFVRDLVEQCIEFHFDLSCLFPEMRPVRLRSGAPAPSG